MMNYNISFNMNLSDYISRLRAMDKLIQLKATGNASEFASKISLSRSMVYKYIDVLKELGGPIEYCCISKTFYYTAPVKLEISFKKKVEV